MAKQDPLHRYKSKRDFAATPEPAGDGVKSNSEPVFVVQKHWARRLHYDLRLELDGTMKSWAVPKGPSFDLADKRMAIHVEDHPLSYNDFEGDIPPGQYGAGKVIVWDRGTWRAVGDPRKGYKNGKLVFELYGHKLNGRWTLIRMKGKSEKQDPWLLIKKKDEYSRSASEFSVVDEMPDSVSVAKQAANKTKPAYQRSIPYKTLPKKLAPQLATLRKAPPGDDGDWLYELKFDGYRILTRIESKNATLYTRNGNDWSDRLPQLTARLNALELPDGWYDGEIVVLDDKGVPDFQQLQNAFDSPDKVNVDYFLFDLLFCDGQDLRSLPQTDRRARLECLLDGARQHSRNKAAHRVRFSGAFEASARDLLASACKLGLEGVIAKRKDAPYVSRRSDAWVKLKCSLRQEFVIAGYTAPQGSRTGFGSLLLGVYDDAGELQYSGNVGTGFSAQSLNAVHQALKACKTSSEPFPTDTRVPHKNVQWLRPLLVAEVIFAGWTQGGHVRHAVFNGLRHDKPAGQIRRETSLSTETSMARTTPSRSLIDRQKITHADRVIDASTGITKGDLLRYYALVTPLIMPHLAGRPVSFLRAPKGVDTKMFFQKHMTAGTMKGVRELPQRLDPDHEPLMEVANDQGLLSAAQMNVVEFHTWNAVKTAMVRPGRMVFDLDPGKGTSWSAMQEAALLIQALLHELELVPFVKTSGGKGLHIVVPLHRRHDWDTVKDFSHQVVQHLAGTFPKRFASKSGPRNRIGKIFIDYLRNGFGATTVCAWSARARPGMAVSVPIKWSEVETLKGSDDWRIANIHERLDVGNNPWKDYDKSARTLTEGRRILKALK